MAVAFVNIGTKASGTGNITPTIPNGVQAGDLMLLYVENLGSESAPSTPSGWTYLNDTWFTTGDNTRMWVAYRWWQSGDSNPQITDTGDHQIANIIAYRGVNSTNPFNVNTYGAATNITWNYGNLTTGVSSTVDNCLFVCFSAHTKDSNTSPITGWGMDGCTSVTGRDYQSTNSGSGGGWLVHEGVKATAGSCGNVTVLVGGDQRTDLDVPWVLIALRPTGNALTLSGSMAGAGTMSQGTNAPSAGRKLTGTAAGAGTGAQAAYKPTMAYKVTGTMAGAGNPYTGADDPHFGHQNLWIVDGDIAAAGTCAQGTNAPSVGRKLTGTISGAGSMRSEEPSFAHQNLTLTGTVSGAGNPYLPTFELTPQIAPPAPTNFTVDYQSLEYWYDDPDYYWRINTSASGPRDFWKLYIDTGSGWYEWATWADSPPIPFEILNADRFRLGLSAAYNSQEIESPLTSTAFWINAVQQVNASGAGALTGEPTVPIQLTGSVTSASTLSGDATQGRALAGACAGGSSLAGEPSVAHQNLSLSGSYAGAGALLSTRQCAGLADSYWSAAYVICVGANQAIGQSFSGDGRQLHSAGFYLSSFQGEVLTGTIVARLYASNEGWPTSGTPSTLLATSSTVLDASVITVTDLWYEFGFAAGTTLTAGTKYFIVVDGSGITNSSVGLRMLFVGAHTPSAIDGNLATDLWGEPVSWAAASTYDLIFRVKTSQAPPQYGAKLAGKNTSYAMFSVDGRDEPTMGRRLDGAIAGAGALTLGSQPTAGRACSGAFSGTGALNAQPTQGNAVSGTVASAGTLGGEPSTNPYYVDCDFPAYETLEYGIKSKNGDGVSDIAVSNMLHNYALAGTTAGAGSLTGQAVRGAVCTGSIAGAGTLSGEPTYQQGTEDFPVSGSVTGAGALSGEPSVAHQNLTLTGAATGAGTLSGEPTKGEATNVLTGTATGVGSLAGEPSVGHQNLALTGAVNGVGSLSGEPSVTHQNLSLSGSVAGAGTLNAQPTMQHQNLTLTGVVTSTATLGGEPKHGWNLAGSINGAGSGAGEPDLTGNYSCTGVMSGAGTLAGAASTGRKLTGALAGAGSLAGEPSVGHQNLALTGAAAGTGSLAGAPKHGNKLTGIVAGTGALNAQPSLTHQNLALQGQCAGAGTLGGQPTLGHQNLALTGSVTGTGALTGTASKGNKLVGAIAGVGSLAGECDEAGNYSLTGSIAGSGTLAGTVKKGNRLTGAVGGTGLLAGTVRAGRKVTGAVSGTGALAGEPGQASSWALAGNIAAAGALTGQPLLNKPLSGAVAGAGSLGGTPAPGRRLAGSITGTGWAGAQATQAHVLAGTLQGAGSIVYTPPRSRPVPSVGGRMVATQVGGTMTVTSVGGKMAARQYGGRTR